MKYILGSLLVILVLPLSNILPSAAAYSSEDEKDTPQSIDLSVQATSAATSELTVEPICKATTKETSEERSEPKQKCALLTTKFVQKNELSIVRDLAFGDGEYARTLAYLLNLPANQVPQFLLHSQAHFKLVSEESSNGPEKAVVLFQKLAAESGSVLSEEAASCPL